MDYVYTKRKKIRQLMKYDRDTLYNNPFSFDYPPPQYDADQVGGWTAISKAIISPKRSFQRYVAHARRWNKLDRTLTNFNAPREVIFKSKKDHKSKHRGSE